ncbi:cytochrome P450 [Ephemerocybe angulata]|uniref:Cytochrome P450 n=1 Tax=Ephemerocybe angulata TaxID=980116 RepID=A0A8H6IA57_9AGAR|nr:cytochrome P450 [Tulosesus angulatus]
MTHTILSTFALLAGTWTVGWIVVKTIGAKVPFAHIPGPPKDSWLTGNLLTVLNKDSWDIHVALAKKYGRIASLHGFLMGRLLYVYDPKALHHIFVKDQYVFEETEEFILANSRLFGTGLLSTLGEHHRKQRKLLNPVFSIAHLRDMTPIFYEVVHKLQTSMLSLVDEAQGGPVEIDMLSWMTRTALELIGQSGFGYTFDTLEPDAVQHPFGLTIKNLVRAVNNGGILVARLLILPYIHKIGSARFQRAIVDALPWKALHELRDMADVMHNTSTEILAATKRSLEDGQDVSKRIGGGKDIMSILLKANEAASEEDRLPESELLAQISTLSFAGMDTTSNALARILQVLSDEREVQDELRQEICNAHNEKGGELDYDTLMALPLLDAVCRETLRVWSPIPLLARHVRSDIVLPLSEPVPTIGGGMTSEIFVPKGTKVLVPIMHCNRDPKIWGPDAADWKPKRWFSPLPETVAKARVPGVYSHMMTFIGGGRACIGFKFAELEMKVVLSVLLQSFCFAPSGKHTVWELNGIIQPTTEDAELTSVGEKKLQLPLLVSLVVPALHPRSIEAPSHKSLT